VAASRVAAATAEIASFRNMVCLLGMVVAVRSEPGDPWMSF
jgi:hypothetical protein